MVRVSVPGKVHLVGEHAVVYGEPTILATVGKRIFINTRKGEKIRIDDEGEKLEWNIEEVKEFGEKVSEVWEKCKEKNDFSEVAKLAHGKNFAKAALGFLLNEFNIDEGLVLRIESDLPKGVGLGYSAALSVGLVKTVSEVFGLGLSLEKVNDLAYEIEKFVHGTPSGGDNSTCCFGGLIWFEKGNPPVIESLQKEVPYKLENFVLACIKEPEKNTGELVQMVRDLNPEFREPRIKAIGRASWEMRKALREKDFQKVKELINLAWKNLSELGLSVPEADEIIDKIVSIGGAAKLCGACGGGIMLAYHEDKERLKNLIRESGYEPWDVELGVEGVKMEV
ncbi:MAG: mevalonate kinase [Candidatus Aenigmatarchaeota archaeon]|nr:MAG: mevalonate kinase [Candidatus Aenigmarchaeota archaeon]